MIVLPPPEPIAKVLEQTRTIAVVGLSPKQHRPSNRVARYLIAAGFTVIPVNPGQDQILDRVCYPSLTRIPVPVDLVDIFRASDRVLPVVQEAITVGVRGIWMQEGIVNEEAADLASRHGLRVIMDRCLMTDHQAWLAASRKHD